MSGKERAGRQKVRIAVELRLLAADEFRSNHDQAKNFCEMDRKLFNGLLAEGECIHRPIALQKYSTTQLCISFFSFLLFLLLFIIFLGF